MVMSHYEMPRSFPQDDRHHSQTWLCSASMSCPSLLEVATVRKQFGQMAS
jgi:hypothetical protein